MKEDIGLIRFSDISHRLFLSEASERVVDTTKHFVNGYTMEQVQVNRMINGGEDLRVNPHALVPIAIARIAAERQHTSDCDSACCDIGNQPRRWYFHNGSIIGTETLLLPNSVDNTEDDK